MTRRKLTKDVWSEIAEDALHTAKEVDCSSKDLADGLYEIVRVLEAQAEVARDEHNKGVRE